MRFLFLFAVSVLCCHAQKKSGDPFSRIETYKNAAATFQRKLEADYIKGLEKLEVLYGGVKNQAGIQATQNAIKAVKAGDYSMKSSHRGVAAMQKHYLEQAWEVSKAMHRDTSAIRKSAIARIEKEIVILNERGRSQEAAVRRNEITKLKALSLRVPGLPDASPDKGVGLRAGLQLHWTFDMLTDRVTDESGRRHHGKILGAPFFEDGVKGRAIKLSNSIQFVECHAPTFNFNGWEGITVSVWVKMSKRTKQGTLMCKAVIPTWKTKGFNPSILEFHLGGTLPGAKAGFSCGGADFFRIPSLAPRGPVLDKWQHFLVTSDGGTGRFYLNGRLDAETKFETPIKVLEEKKWVPFTLGKMRGKQEKAIGHYANTLVDELKIWSRALSPEEARTVFGEVGARK